MQIFIKAPAGKAITLQLESSVNIDNLEVGRTLSYYNIAYELYQLTNCTGYTAVDFRRTRVTSTMSSNSTLVSWDDSVNIVQADRSFNLAETITARATPVNLPMAL
ncbi:hypothetical protein MPER_01372 [Moniliophthora perniciosa FA553]|nr:hypothetical protein MPER_01372 [Moniliophthora perniciosa FA553]